MLNNLYQLCQESPAERQPMGAIITDKRDNVLVRATNLPGKTHPEQAEYARKAGKPELIYLHAEIRALILLNVRGYRMYVGRINKHGNMALAKPCPVCQLAIREGEIQETFFTTQAGELAQLTGENNDED